MGGLVRLVAWHLSGRPVGLPSRWAATSTVELGQTTYRVNRGRVVMEKRVELGPKSQRGGEERSEWNRGPLAEERGLCLDICVGVPEFLVTPLLMGPVCLLRQGRFEEPGRRSLFINVRSTHGAQ